MNLEQYEQRMVEREETRERVEKEIVDNLPNNLTHEQVEESIVNHLHGLAFDIRCGFDLNESILRILKEDHLRDMLEQAIENDTNFLGNNDG